MKRLSTILFTIILPLITGLLIYLCYRPTSIILFRWFDLAGMGSPIHSMRAWSHALHPSSWIVFNLPDALWIYAFVNAMLLIWNYKVTRSSALWIFLAPLTALILEFGQLFHIVPGTFDFLDILFILVAAFTPFISFLKPNNNETI